MSKLAVVDIGTNSIHMVLADIGADFSYTVLDRFKDMTRLGDGSFKTHRLSTASIHRGVEVIQNLTSLAHNKGFDQIIATATSAVREAKNGGEFLKAVLKQTGLRVRVVSGHEEARLIYLGVRHSMELSDGPSLIVDVGGGSVELIACNRNRMLFGKSLKLGAIRLKDLYVKEDPPQNNSIKQMEKMIDRQLQLALKGVKEKQIERVVATSGMAANLTEIIYLRRTGRPLGQLNLADISLDEVRAVESQLKKRDLQSRLNISGLDPRRVDTILPATMVLRHLMEHTHLTKMIISDKAIREGLIYDFIERHQEGIRAEQEIPNIRWRHVTLFARRCQYSEVHSRHVVMLATMLFDQTQSLHGLGQQEREWLEFAALLHDVGYLVHVRQHHKHSYYLIKHGDISGLTEEEVEIIANVARYHRRAMPQLGHATFKALGKLQRTVVQVLSALLRVADGLDRSHFSVVRDVNVVIGPTILLTLHCIGDPELEIWAARNRADLFEKVFQRPVQFVAQTVNGHHR